VVALSTVASSSISDRYSDNTSHWYCLPCSPLTVSLFQPRLPLILLALVWPRFTSLFHRYLTSSHRWKVPPSAHSHPRVLRLFFFWENKTRSTAAAISTKCVFRPTANGTSSIFPCQPLPHDEPNITRWPRLRQRTNPRLLPCLRIPLRRKRKKYENPYVVFLLPLQLVVSNPTLLLTLPQPPVPNGMQLLWSTPVPTAYGTAS
jgi:hypothetical protein